MSPRCAELKYNGTLRNREFADDVITGIKTRRAGDQLTDKRYVRVHLICLFRVTVHETNSGTRNQLIAMSKVL